MKLVNIGFGNMVSAEKLVAIVGHQSAPIKRIIQEARDSGYLIDGTYGRKTRAVIIMDSGHVVLSAVQPETVAGRFDDKDEDIEKDNDAVETADDVSDEAANEVTEEAAEGAAE